MQAEGVAQPAQQGADDFFRRGMFAADARHVPRATSFSQAVPIHGGNLTAKNAKNTEKCELTRKNEARLVQRLKSFLKNKEQL
jgi:hypothetical protein